MHYVPLSGVVSNPGQVAVRHGGVELLVGSVRLSIVVCQVGLVVSPQADCSGDDLRPSREASKRESDFLYSFDRSL